MVKLGIPAPMVTLPILDSEIRTQPRVGYRSNTGKPPVTDIPADPNGYTD